MYISRSSDYRDIDGDLVRCYFVEWLRLGELVTGGGGFGSANQLQEVDIYHINYERCNDL
jgi:hypothetical protein